MPRILATTDRGKLIECLELERLQGLTANARDDIVCHHLTFGEARCAVGG